MAWPLRGGWAWLDSGLSARAGQGLLNQLLTFDPKQRISAQAGLEHEYFKVPARPAWDERRQCEPLPKHPDMMPTFPTSHKPDKRPPE